MMNVDAVVFGLYETGLGVAKSLGSNGVKVVGIDHKKDLGFYSRYITAKKSPHPVSEEEEFLSWLTSEFRDVGKRLPVFISSDDYLYCISKHEKILKEYFDFNMPDNILLEKISDKYTQSVLAEKTGISVPKTYVLDIYNQEEASQLDLQYPVFVKGKDVNLWRKKIHGRIKGFKADNELQLQAIIKDILDKGVPVIIQELILGKDTNHYKYCVYIDQSGEISAEFTLQKIRQNPPHFGVGSVVKSIYHQDLIEQGRRLFQGIEYRGIGSAEFKIDERDEKLKLIEINPRYWQQNFLSTYCGMNFPLINYFDLTKHQKARTADFKENVLWINRQLDFDSFMQLRKEKAITFRQWRNSRKGEKIFSNFSYKDPLPALYNIEFGWKLIKAPVKLLGKLMK